MLTHRQHSLTLFFLTSRSNSLLFLLSIVLLHYSLILKHSQLIIQIDSNKTYSYSSNIQTDLPIVSHLTTKEQKYIKIGLRPFILRKQTRNQTETNVGPEARNMNTDALNEAQNRRKKEE